ncbi:cell division protein ZapB [Bathymodiolus japonicus methanotrophic gill symbiont]|nr:cell division protein ZapB [Bathymodiolus japonicus methanotrophic gill symbiont]
MLYWRVRFQDNGSFMNTNNQSFDIYELEKKQEELIQRYNSVQNENTTLKVKQDELVKEKAKLLEKTNMARTRVEAMISRLKTMEHGT